jgi:RNase H-like domain found in reverse transcriptase
MRSSWIFRWKSKTTSLQRSCQASSKARNNDDSTREGRFAVVDTTTKVDHLLLGHDEFSIMSDHLNLTYIYNSLSADPTLARNVVHKVKRWALKMSVVSYRMEHLMIELNYWTDLMTR